MAKQNKFYLFNMHVLRAICFLVLQQLIVASSTIWIARLIANIQLGSFSYALLGLYLSSLLLPYLPGAFALVSMTKAKAYANVQYVNEFASRFRGQIVDWTDSFKQSLKSSILTGEASQSINGNLDYIYHFASCSINVAFNLVVLALIIEPLLFVSFSIGILLAFFILKIQKKWKRTLALRAQHSRIKWISMLLKAWDNILLNNVYNFDIWQKKTNQRSKRFVKSSLKLEALSQSVSIGMAFVLLGPTFLLVAYLPVIEGFNLTKLAIMVVALPRLFQVLSYSYELLFVLADYPMQKSRFNTIASLIEQNHTQHSEKSFQNLKQRVQWDKLNVTFDGGKVTPDMLLTSIPSKGRYTVSGENGSGKSSFLLLLKMIKGDEAFYLPVKHDLFFKHPKHGFSTGQLVKHTLHEILEYLKSPIVLLDEWDANLDKVNQQQLSQLIDQIAQTKCVVEVRHK